jgi:hypothetical protein
MARDVEINVTASDRTGEALAAAERAFKRTSDNVKRESKKTGDGVAEGLVSAIERFSPKLAAGITQTLTDAGAAGGPLLVGGLVASAPLLAATLSAAVIGGAGIGGVIGGVLLAARDARVQAAGKDLGTRLLGSLEQDAVPFIQPVLKAIDTIGDSFDRVNGRIKNIFANSSRFVEPLVNGATKGFEGILRGIDSLVANAGPVIAALSDGLAQLGNSVGDLFEQIGGQSGGAAAALRDIFDVLSSFLTILGPVIAGLTKVYEVLSKFGVIKQLAYGLAGPIGMVAQQFDRAGESARKTGSGSFAAADGFQAAKSGADKMATALQSTTASADAMREATRQLTDQNNGLYSSTTSVASAISNASKTISENGRNLALNSAKGRENRDALSSVAQAARQNYDAFVKVNGVGPKSAALAETLRGSFIRLAEKAGKGASEARNLANQLLGIPSKRDTKISLEAAKALENAREVRRAISAVQGKTVTVTVKVNAGALNKARLGKLGPQANLAASSSFAFANGAGGGRTGGPAAVTVDNQTNVRVDLDGRQFREYTNRTVDEAVSRAAYRQKVGTR